MGFYTGGGEYFCNQQLHWLCNFIGLKWFCFLAMENAKSQKPTKHLYFQILAMISNMCYPIEFVFLPLGCLPTHRALC